MYKRLFRSDPIDCSFADFVGAGTVIPATLAGIPTIQENMSDSRSGSGMKMQGGNLAFLIDVINSGLRSGTRKLVIQNLKIEPDGANTFEIQYIDVPRRNEISFSSWQDPTIYAHIPACSDSKQASSSASSASSAPSASSIASCVSSSPSASSSSSLPSSSASCVSSTHKTERKCWADVKEDDENDDESDDSLQSAVYMEMKLHIDHKHVEKHVESKRPEHKRADVGTRGANESSNRARSTISTEVKQSPSPQLYNRTMKCHFCSHTTLTRRVPKSTDTPRVELVAICATCAGDAKSPIPACSSCHSKVNMMYYQDRVKMITFWNSTCPDCHKASVSERKVEHKHEDICCLQCGETVKRCPYAENAWNIRCSECYHNGRYFSCAECGSTKLWQSPVANGRIELWCSGDEDNESHKLGSYATGELVVYNNAVLIPVENPIVLDHHDSLPKKVIDITLE